MPSSRAGQDYLLLSTLKIRNKTEFFPKYITQRRGDAEENAVFVN
jgi:hypothetical protein